MILTFKSITSRSPGYRADIDGLRAVAVLCVIVFHLSLGLMPGGFVGVDVFLVISGYLITQVIQTDIARGKFSFLSFYDRRIRRILPALVAMALVCTAIAALLFPPGDLLSYGKSLLATTGFGSNFFFEQLDNYNGYFGSPSASQPLLHMWTLSLEEQFYLFHPIVLLLLNRLARQSKPVTLLACIALSFAFSVWGTIHQPVAAFYLLPSRAWELLIGAFLALRPLPQLTSRIGREIAALAGFAMISYAALRFTQYIPFPGINALLPCVGAGLILYTGESGSSLTSRALSLRPVVFIGRISYSLYLWHWPLIVFFRFIKAGQAPSGKQACALLLLSLLLALLSFELVESPFRRRPAQLAPKRTVWVACGVSAVLASLALVIIVSGGLPDRFDPKTQEILEKNEARTQDYEILSQCGNFRKKVSQASDVSYCEIGHSSRNILFWGDSHVQELYPLLVKIQPELHGEGIVLAAAPGCTPTEHLNNSIPGYYCDAFNRFVMQRAMKDDIDTVFIGFYPWWVWEYGKTCIPENSICVQLLSQREAGRQVRDGWASEFHALRARGKRVILALPFPAYDKSIPDFEIASAIAGGRWRVSEPQEMSSADMREQFQDLAMQTGAELYDPREALCTGQQCMYQMDSVSLYKDGVHIAASQVGILRQGLLKILLQTHVSDTRPAID